MKLRTLCMLLVLVLLAVFLVINWSALSQDMTVNLVYQEIQAPLGVIVAAAFGIVVVLQAFYNLWQQASFDRLTKKPAMHELKRQKPIKTVSMSLLEKSVKGLPAWRHSSRSSKKQRQS